jgi:hypothetical protein
VTQQLRPDQLRARAALDALAAAQHLLADRVIEEDRAIAAEHRAAAEPLRSPSYGRRMALGGHGDPTAEAVGTIAAPRANRWIALEAEVDQQLLAVAQHLPGARSTNPVAQIRAALPGMSERAAGAAAQLANRVDGRIRRLLGEPSDRQLVPRVRCPACDATGLVLRTAAPLAEQVIECTTCDQAWIRSKVMGSVGA